MAVVRDPGFMNRAKRFCLVAINQEGSNGLLAPSKISIFEGESYRITASTYRFGFLVALDPETASRWVRTFREGIYRGKGIRCSLKKGTDS